MADLFAISAVQGEVAQHVILFHGLEGHPHDTWRSINEPKVCWPRWLAEDIQGLAVWSVGYDAAVSRWRGSAMHLTDRATNVLERILAEPKLQSGELILIGHSLGGVLIKQLLRTADSMALQRSEVGALIKRVRRVIFIATPHSGAALATLVDRLRILVRPSLATASLVCNDPNLRDLNLWYREWSSARHIEHLILTENKFTRFAGLIVNPDSSDPGLLSRPIPIDADHITICKPIDRTSEVYVHVRNFIIRPATSMNLEKLIESTLETQSARIETLTDTIREHSSQLKDAISDQVKTTAEIVTENLSRVASSVRLYPKDLVDNEIEKQLSIIRRARFFGGFSASECALRLGDKILNGELAGGSDTVNSSALAWCARFIATAEHRAKFDEFLTRAKQLGTPPEIVMAEAFRISADGDIDGALSKLASLTSPAGRSAAFRIVAQHKKAAAAIDWLSKSGLRQSDLDADGKFFLITSLLELARWDVILDHVVGLQEDDFQSAPALFYIAAISHVVQAIPNELKSLVLHQIPFEASNFPLASTEASLKSRRKSQELFQKCTVAAQELGCVEVANVTQDYALWLELRDPEGYVTGHHKLEESMREPTHSLRRLHLALQFGLKVDLDAVEQEIEHQTTISGGHSHVAAMARFALAFTRKNPKDIASYIDHHRIQLFEHLDRKSLSILEVEMLARAGLANRAEERLRKLAEDGLSDTEKNHLLRIIAESTGSDPVEARKAQFESSGQLMDLVNLIALLEKRNDWSQLCHYGSLLFDRTKALSDIERLAGALDKVNRHGDLASLLRQYPDLVNQSDNLQMLWSWSLYREGLLAESKTALEKLRNKRDHPSDRALLINLAVASGAWETLLPYLEIEWTQMEQRQADELIQSALLAQVVGSPRTKDLVHAAAAKATSNAGILVAGYTIATRGGWEDEPTVAQWLQKAAELSDDSGPLQKVSLKDLLDRAPQWNRRETDTWEHLNRGTLPIFGVARLLNRTLVDMFLLPALANPSERDPRKRALIPAYSGVRHSLTCNYPVIAIDATTLLTLGTLGLLEMTCNSFDAVLIPHSTLRWLFEEKREVTFHQPSRIKNASKIRGLLATGALKTLTKSTRIDADLAAEVGEELASLIAEALASDSVEERQRLVVRSSPVHRVGSLMEEEADLSQYSSYLCSCVAIVNKLKHRGQLTAREESQARAYLRLHEKEWPHQPEIADDAVLFLDDLSVSYLEHTGLLVKLQAAGLETYISGHKLNEVNALLRYEQLASEVEKVIETIRSFLALGIQTGKIKVGPIAHLDEAEKSAAQDHPTFAIFHLGKHAEAITADDRFLNEHPHIDDGSSHTPILTTLDLLDALYLRRDITFERMLDCRTKLRQAGYVFVPVTTAELEHHLSVAEVVDGRLVETAELKAIRENVLRIRMTSFLQLPKEAPWITGLMQTLTHTLTVQWHREMDESTARARSDWLIELLDVRKWAHRLHGDHGVGKVEQNYGVQIMSLLYAPSNLTAETKEKYWQWIDDRILIRIREENPEIYLWLINRTKELIAHIASKESEIVANSPSESSLLALAALRNFPPAIRESIISDPVFAHIYGLKADALISFNDGQVSIQRSELFGSIRKILADNKAQPILKDTAGKEWRLEFFELNNARRLALLQERRRFVLADFSPLSPDQPERITGLDHVAHNIHLPQETVSIWHEILAARALTDDEMIEFHRDVENTPIRLAAVIGSETKKGEITFWSMVPRSEEYFVRLVGKCETGQNVEKFTRAGAARHIRELMSWRPYDGLLFSLLLSSHSSISSAIDVDQIEERDLVRAYEWLQNNGDRISQLGAIEIGLSVWDKYQNIHPYVQNMVDQIRDDDADDEKSRFQLLSALIILVDGEIARTRILREKPPFWRRLASIAQASLIERHIKSQVDIAEFSKWSFETRGQLFYLQTMVDLRREPRWHPDYVSSHQLKAEFIGRIHNAARQNATKIQNSTLREALIGDGPESLQRLVVFPQTFLPGPLEGGLIAQIEPPTDILTEIEKQLSQDVLEPKSFIALMNSALVFRLDLQQARLAAKAMRAAKYHLSRMNNKDLVSILRGLATVAAVTRSDELAQELRILARKYRQQPGDNLSAENALWIGLIAAASHSELTDWCVFVGDWITDLAFQSLQLDEMQRLHFHVEQMCHIVPDLWPTCGRAEAALSSCEWLTHSSGRRWG